MSIELKVIAFLLAAIAAVGAVIGFGHARFDAGQSAGRAYVQAQWNAEKVVQLAAAQKQEEANRAIETQRATQAQEIADELDHEKSLTAAALARAATTERLRAAAVSAYASVVGRVPGDTGTVPGIAERAATLGRLLNTCRDQSTSDAGDLEGLASQVRGLQASYLSLTQKGKP